MTINYWGQTSSTYQSIT